jgi:hypothetical protein
MEPHLVHVMNSPKTMSVPAAGKLYFELSRNASYDAARRDPDD